LRLGDGEGLEPELGVVVERERDAAFRSEGVDRRAPDAPQLEDRRLNERPCAGEGMRVAGR